MKREAKLKQRDHVKVEKVAQASTCVRACSQCVGHPAGQLCLTHELYQ